MRIQNETHVDTNGLRRVFQSVLTLDNKYETKIKSKDLMVKVVYGRSWWTGGSAWVGHEPRYLYLKNGRLKRLPNITIKLPAKKYFNNSFTDAQIIDRQDRWMLAYVFLHELQHTRGHRHRKINDKNLKELVKHIKFNKLKKGD